MTDRHHAINVKDKWTLPKIYANVVSRLLHTHGGKEPPFYLTKSNAWYDVSVDLTDFGQTNVKIVNSLFRNGRTQQQTHLDDPHSS
jgi:hypothetical protein